MDTRSGRLTGVTGANFAGVSQYASDFQYRAWGALEHLDYGNTRDLDINYEVRLNISRFEVPGIMGMDVQYHPDGNARYAQDRMETNSKFDRAFSFDHVGQLSQALTGSEARGVSLPDGPFNESLAHDVWSNMTSRSMRHWTQINSFTGSYVNNRNPAWQYDAAGNPTVQGESTEYTYDAEGRQTRSYDPLFTVLCSTSQGSGPTVISLTLINSFDGNGRKVKQSETCSTNPGSPGLTQHTYFVRSSVVRGAVINELSGTGTKSLGFVYAGGDKLARQVQNGTNQAVGWEHRNPVTGSEWRTDNVGVKSDRVELDPLGGDVGLTNPYTGGGGGDCEWSQIQYPRFGSVFDLGTGCVIEGIEAPCDMVTRLLENGTAARCPNGDCGPRTIEVVTPDGRRIGFLTGPWNPTADEEGFNGFLMAGVRYVGNGYAINPWVDPGNHSETLDLTSSGSGIAYFMNPSQREGESRRRVSRRENGQLPQNPETERPLTQEQRKSLQKIIDSAVHTLETNEDCRNYIKGNSTLNPIDVIKSMAMSSYTYFNGSVFAAGELQAIAANRGGWTRQGDTSSPAHIVFGYLFFDSEVGSEIYAWSATPEVARAETLLHEFMHYISQNRNHEGWDVNIYKKCFGAARSYEQY